MAAAFPADTLTDKIDALLPQTQCGKCGYPACRPYAEAIAAGKADINQCPPGGTATIYELAHLLDITPKPLNPAYGVEKTEKTVAVIDENLCIGCVLCIRACPVDAILGAAKQMHTVIAQECTGCGLCIAPCPVDCIMMVPDKSTLRSREHNREKANLARRRYEFRQQRLLREKAEHTARLLKNKTSRPDENSVHDNIDKKAVILAAVERVRKKRLRSTTPTENKQ